MSRRWREPHVVIAVCVFLAATVALVVGTLRSRDDAATTTVAPLPSAEDTGIVSTSAASTVAPTPSSSTSRATSRSASTRTGGAARPATLGADARALGVAAGSTLPMLAAAELDRRLAGMAALGATWVRFDIEWSNVQRTGPGRYDWSDYDRVVRAADAHGLRPLAILDYTPEWARAPECAGSPVCRPRSADEFGRFAGAAAARYAPRGVHAWEIWNEPNLRQFYEPRPDPAGYTGLLRAAHRAIKAADPRSSVLVGGTAPTSTADDGSTLRATRFLSGVYAAGGKGSFDAVAHHPYTFPYTPEKAFPGGAWSDLTALHSIMASHGDGRKKVWASEYGAPTGGTGTVVDANVRKVYTGATHVTESLQATIATNAVERYRRFGWAGPLFWYTYADSSGSSSSIENYFGLVRPDGSRKPAFDALRRAAR